MKCATQMTHRRDKKTHSCVRRQTSYTNQQKTIELISHDHFMCKIAQELPGLESASAVLPTSPFFAPLFRMDQSLETVEGTAVTAGVLDPALSTCMDLRENVLAARAFCDWLEPCRFAGVIIESTSASSVCCLQVPSLLLAPVLEFADPDLPLFSWSELGRELSCALLSAFLS